MGRTGSTTNPSLKTFGACVAHYRAHEECLTSLNGSRLIQHEEYQTIRSLVLIAKEKSNALYSDEMWKRGVQHIGFKRGRAPNNSELCLPVLVQLTALPSDLRSPRRTWNAPRYPTCRRTWKGRRTPPSSRKSSAGFASGG